MENSRDESLTAFNRPSSIATMVVLMAVGPAVYLLLPAFVGAIAETYGFTKGQLGLLASADVAGMAVAAVTAFYWRTRWSWRWVLSLSLAWVVIGNLLNTGVAGFGPMLTLRLLVGLGGGLVVAACLAFLSYTRDTDRVAAMMIIGQILFIVVFIPTAQKVFGAWGIDGIFVGLALITAVMIPFTVLFPVGPPEGDETATVRFSFRQYIPGLVVLVALGLFQATQAGVWAFAELLGKAEDISAARVATVLSLTALISLIGPLVVAIIGDRYGRFLPIAAAVVLQLGIIIPLGLGGYGFVAFFIYMAIFQLCWVTSVSYQYGVLAQVDVTKQLMVLSPTFQAVGVALGPALVGLGIGAMGYLAVAVIPGLVIVLFAALILPFAGRPANAEPVGETE